MYSQRYYGTVSMSDAAALMPVYNRDLFRVFVWDAAGEIRRYTPLNIVQSADWYIERYGGYGAFSLVLAGTGDELADIEKVQIGDRVEFWYDTDCRYRGYVTRPGLTLEDPLRRVYTGFGLFAFIGETIIKRKLPYGEAVDASTVFADIADAYVIPHRSGIERRVFPVGVTTEQGDYRGKSVKEAFDSLVDLSANAATWGCYTEEFAIDPLTGLLAASPTRRDMLLFQPIGDTDDPDWGIHVPASNVSAAGSETDMLDVWNAVYIEGGDPANPNLLANGGFWDVVRAGNGVGNLIPDGDFEALLGVWNVGGGAAGKAGGGIEGQPYNGDHMVETDGAGEYFQQTRTGIAGSIAPEKPYTYSMRAKLEQGAHPTTNQILFEWLDIDGNPINDDSKIDQSVTLTGAGGYSSWKAITFSTRAPAGADGFHIKVTQTSASGESEGTIWDFFQLYDSSAIRQNGWEYELHGAAKVIAEDWANLDAWDDDFSVRLITADVLDDDDNDIHLQMRGKARYQVNSGQQIRFIAYLKAPLGADPGTYISPKIQLIIRGYDRNGGGGDSNVVISDVPAGSVPADGQWYRFEATRNYSVDEASGTAYLAIRGSGDILIDGLCVRDISETESIPDGVYRITLRASDLFADDSTPGDPHYDIWNSVNVYGYREKILSLPSITNREDAVAFATPFFLQSAVESDAPQVTLLDSPDAFLPGDTVRLSGGVGKKLTGSVLPIARVHCTWKGTLTTDLDLQREARDEASEVLEMIERRVRALGGPPSGVQAGAQPAVSGGTVGGITQVYWGSTPRTSTDATLHDAYQPAGGVHILNSERTNWNNTQSELISARSRTGSVSWPDNTYSDLPAHFTALWDALGANGVPDPSLASADLDTILVDAFGSLYWGRPTRSITYLSAGLGGASNTISSSSVTADINVFRLSQNGATVTLPSPDTCLGKIIAVENYTQLLGAPSVVIFNQSFANGTAETRNVWLRRHFDSVAALAVQLSTYSSWVIIGINQRRPYIRYVSADDGLYPYDELVVVDASSADVNLALPAFSETAFEFGGPQVKAMGGNDAIINADSVNPDTIDGASSLTIPSGSKAWILPNQSEWTSF